MASISPGDYRVKIERAEEQLSKNGHNMIKLTLKASGQSKKLYYYLVFLDDHPKITNDKLKRIFDSFGIIPGDMNLLNWCGKIGAARVVHDTDDKGITRAKVKTFIQRKKQGVIPAWIN